jgi:DNA polymerase III epsilon subunit-like protein
MSTQYALAFVDVESTGLDPFLHSVWEIAVIFREGDLDTEHVFHIEPDLTNAHPKALEINRYHERTSAPGWKWGTPANVAERVQGLLRDTILVGSNPSFDAAMISAFIGRHHPNPKIKTAPWYHHTLDIATLAAGYRFGQAASGAYGGDFTFPADYPQVPFRSYDMSRAVGVEPPAKDVAHTALGDAAWARDVYDAVTGGKAVTG